MDKEDGSSFQIDLQVALAILEAMKLQEIKMNIWWMLSLLKN